MKLTTLRDASFGFALARSALPLAAASALLLGCSSEAPSPSSPASPGPGPAPSANYYRDIKPVVDSRCNGCHVEGGVGPFPLTTYEQVSSQKDGIRWAVSERIMPPWLAADGCNEYQHDRSLSDDEIALITGWVDAGAPEGDPKDAVAGGPGDTQGLSRVDRTLASPEPYLPQGGPDDYRCFVLDWPEQATTYVTGLGIEPGVPAMLHHMIAYVAKPDSVAEYEQMDAAEPGPGYTCYGGPGGRPAWIGGWAPGAQGYDMPAGTGIEIQPGSKVIMQIHYNMSYTKAQPDATKLLFKLDPSVEKKAGVVPWLEFNWILNNDMPIPAHSVDVSHSVSKDPTPYVGFLTDNAITSNQPLTIHTAALHMHTFGKSGTIAIERQDGTSACLLNVPRWDFHWQGWYFLKDTITLNPGDKLRLECHWDNPTDNDLNWGESTSDEMCLSTFYVTQ
jgi:hypothetical protein